MKIEAGKSYRTVTYAEAEAAHESGQRVELRYKPEYKEDDDWAWVCRYFLNAKPDHCPYEFRIAEPDPYAELKAAQAAGKVIQEKGSWEDWRDLDDPKWTRPVSCYRVKPDPKPELTIEKCAEQLINQNETREQTLERSCRASVELLEQVREVVEDHPERGIIDAHLNQLRKLLTPAPYDNWDKVPAWANWQALNQDGHWWFYEFKPSLCSNGWGVRSIGRGDLPSQCRPTNFTGTWENSLQERPKE